tara:strand:- start:305 stop:481 length:177 start_codon:yes stop_codon:yes gene_type:complete
MELVQQVVVKVETMELVMLEQVVLVVVEDKLEPQVLQEILLLQVLLKEILVETQYQEV